MHEYSVTQEVLRLIVDECRRAGIVKPARALLELGRLSGFHSEPIQLYFGLLKEAEPLLKETVLEIREVEAAFRCTRCGQEHVAEDLWMLSCPRCPGAATEITRGKDLLLKSITGETSDDNQGNGRNR